MGSWLRGKLLTAGLAGDSPLGDVLDAVTALIPEVPHKTLTDLRDNLELAKIAAGGDRSNWGALPHQQQSMQPVFAP